MVKMLLVIGVTPPITGNQIHISITVQISSLQRHPHAFSNVEPSLLGTIDIAIPAFFPKLEGTPFAAEHQVHVPIQIPIDGLGIGNQPSPKPDPTLFQIQFEASLLVAKESASCGLSKATCVKTTAYKEIHVSILILIP